MADITFNYKGNTIGEISASGTHTLDTEGMYCEDDIKVVYVKPSGGSVDYFDLTWPTGALVTNDTALPQYFFNGRTGITKITATNLTQIASHYFRGCTSVEEIDCGTKPFGNPSQYVFRGDSSLKGFAYKYTGNSTTSIAIETFYQCAALKYFDGAISAISQTNVFNGCTVLETLVLRRTAGVTSLANTNSFDNTPFAANGTGGTLYVPNSLISSYQAASNWSTILGRANNSIKSIESTHTDPTAPIDLTLYYADGTLIPT